MRFSTQILSLFSSLLFVNWMNLANGEEPFYREIVGDDETAIYAHIGPAGGDRGYYAITGQQPYNDLAWYLNGMLIPELVLRRGTTYYFYVNGGNNNPIYISDTNYGGYAQLSANDRLEQQLFAGVTPTGWNSAGGVTSYEAPGWGPICYYEPTSSTSADAASFLEYYETLDTSCASDTWLIGQAGVLEFTPDAWTPDTLYYQSVNFQNMGYKITVIDADAPAATSSPTASPTSSQTPWPTKAPTWAPVASPVNLDDFEEMALSGLLNGATLFYKFNEADTRANGEDTISIVLEVPSEAWAAWAVSTNGAMVGSEAVLGFPDTGEVMKYNIDAKNPSGIVAMSDDKQTLIDTSITQGNGITTLSFTKILNEDGEIEIKSDDDNIFLSAWGSSNSLGYHASRAAYTVTANVPDVTPTDAPVAAPTADNEGDFQVMALTGGLTGSTLSFKINENDSRANGEDTISIILEVPSEAWVAWAISEGGTMVGSEAVIGFPESGEVLKYNLNAKSLTGVTPMADDQQTLIDTNIEQGNGVTTLSFTKILSESGEIEIKSGEDNLFLSAWGGSNTLGIHSVRGAYSVSLAVEEEDDDFEVMELSGGLSGSTLRYKFNEGDSRANGEDTISVVLEVPSEAWTAWAISEAGSMVGSEAVIGFPDTGEVLKYNLNAKSLTGVVPMPDDQQTLIDTSIEQGNGVTTLSFTKILSESGEITIKSDEDNIFLSAWGSSNTLGIHSVRGAYAVSPVQEEEDDDEVPVFDDEDFEILALEGQLGGSDLRFKFNQNDARANGKDTISVILQVPTEAWAAMAFSDNGGFMLGSEAVIGLPNTGEVLKYNLDAKSLSGVVPMPDEQQTLIDTSIEQIGGTTILSFTKILEETGEITINLEEDNTFLTAWGSSNNLGIHSVRGSYSLEGKVLDTRKENLWKLHGWLASIAWTVLSPMAISSSILRRFIQGDGTWFQIHRTLNMMVVAFTIAAVITAYLAINQETPDGAKAQHFSSDVSGGHRTIGGVIFILALLQAIGGILRPHAPHKPEPENDEEAHQGDKLDAVPEKTAVRFFWEVGHRTLGLGILCLCWYQVALGIETFSDIFNGGDEGAMMPAYYAVVGTFALIMIVGYVMKAMAPV